MVAEELEQLHRKQKVLQEGIEQKTLELEKVDHMGEAHPHPNPNPSPLTLTLTQPLMGEAKPDPKPNPVSAASDFNKPNPVFAASYVKDRSSNPVSACGRSL